MEGSFASVLRCRDICPNSTRLFIGVVRRKCPNPAGAQKMGSVPVLWPPPSGLDDLHAVWYPCQLESVRSPIFVSLGLYGRDGKDWRICVLDIFQIFYFRRKVESIVKLDTGKNRVPRQVALEELVGTS